MNSLNSANSPNYISTDEVGLDLSRVSKRAIQVVEQLQSAGFDAYLVGGCVRDLILGLKPKDFDVSTNATPEQVKGVFKRNARIIGRRFKIVHVRFGYEVIEVATFRASADDRDKVGQHEMSEGREGQLLRDNVYGVMDEDVMRRDFTANALYLDPVEGEIVDYLGGINDIREARLVSIGEATQRFREDPVRMLRVIRFAAKLDFSMEDDALAIIKEEGRLLSHVAPARLFEEVLKLFHGGAALKTYEMLRAYDLFKFLFPFTDQVSVDGVQGLPERALKNTDLRIAQGKPVIPAFLFACMLWDPVKADAQVLLDGGNPETQAWRIAMSDALRDQHQYVAVPRRLAEIILDIWNIHFKLIQRSPKQIKSILSNRRFRAAYDFLLLRTSVNEVDESVSEWWTQIQEVDVEGKNDMIEGLRTKSSRRQADPDEQALEDSEPNFNSLDYQSGVSAPGVYVPRANQPQNRVSAGKKKSGGKRRKRAKKVTHRTAGSEPRAESGRPNSAAPKNATNGPVGGRKKRRRRASSGKKKGPNRGSKPGVMADNAPFVEARPKDEYGSHSGGDADLNKVKVRRKKKVEVDPDRLPNSAK